jgi:hypothetical protein
MRARERTLPKHQDRIKKQDPGPKPEVLNDQDWTSCVDHRIITRTGPNPSASSW